MKTKILALLTLVVMCTAGTFAQDRKILVAYFSWSGNTQHVAEYIARQTGGTLFRIEPVKPYPTEYTPCTEVAKAEKEQNARPAIKNRVADWNSYDTIFIGCPVSTPLPKVTISKARPSSPSAPTPRPTATRHSPRLPNSHPTPVT